MSTAEDKMSRAALAFVIVGVAAIAWTIWIFWQIAGYVGLV